MQGTNKKKPMWIAWEDDTSIRSQVLAAEMKADYRAFTRFTDSKFFSWLRYPLATAQTIWMIIGKRPSLLVVQNPSILLAFEAALLRRFIGYELVIDLHTPFIHPTGIRKSIASFLHLYSLRNCSYVIVTNEAYKNRVAQQTPRPILILPDKVPDIGPASRRFEMKGRLNIAYICTFSVDEPWREVIAAGALLPEDICIYISGRSPLSQDELPRNVILTGYLPRQDYQNLLRSVDAVMVLTTADDNLLCGGYEAVAVGKPLVLSNTRALKGFFSKGTVFTENRSADIAQAIRSVDTDARRLTTAIEKQKEDMTLAWEDRWRTLLAQLRLSTDAPQPHATGLRK